MIAGAPGIWTIHFLLSYLTVSLWCAKVAAPGGALGGARVAIGIYTAVALAGIAFFAWEGLRRHRHGGTETAPHDFDTPEDRHRFLGFATLLLSGLSAVATVFVALAAVFFESCR